MIRVTARSSSVTEHGNVWDMAEAGSRMKASGDAPNPGRGADQMHPVDGERQPERTQIDGVPRPGHQQHGDEPDGSQKWGKRESDAFPCPRWWHRWLRHDAKMPRGGSCPPLRR